MQSSGLETLARLRKQRDLIALVRCAKGDAVRGPQLAASWLGIESISLADVALTPHAFDEAWHPVRDTLLHSIDLLFSPQLPIEPLSHLRRLGRSVALVAVWPGQIAGGRLTYSRPGRRDHYDVPARHVLVLDPVETHFPDEDPYTAEYYPA